MLPRLISFWALVLGTAACTVSMAQQPTTPRGKKSQVTSAGFVHGRHSFSVPVGAGGRVLPDDWILDNYYVDPGGKVKAKKSDDYLSHYSIDAEGDGRADLVSIEPTYDLRYTNARHAGVIWLRSFPVSPRFAQMDLPVLTQAYADEIAGVGYEVVLLQGSVVGEMRTYAARIVGQAPVAIAGAPAHAMTLDVANVEQLQLTPDAIYRRVRVVIVRPGFTYTERKNGREIGFPVLIVAGYANQPERFADGEADFERLLTLITINGQQGIAPVSALRELTESAEPGQNAKDALDPAEQGDESEDSAGLQEAADLDDTQPEHQPAKGDPTPGGVDEKEEAAGQVGGEPSMSQ